MATRTPTPKKYAQLTRQIGRKGVQKGVETLAEQRVMRHQKMTHSEAQAYIRARTAEGHSVGGFTPSPKQKKAVKVGSGNGGPSKPAPKAATKQTLTPLQVAMRKRMEQQGVIKKGPPPQQRKANNRASVS